MSSERDNQDAEDRTTGANAAFDKWFVGNVFLDASTGPQERAQIMNNYRAVWLSAVDWADGYNIVGAEPTPGTKVLAMVRMLALDGDEKVMGTSLMVSHATDVEVALATVLTNGAAAAVNALLKKAGYIMEGGQIVKAQEGAVM